MRSEHSQRMEARELATSGALGSSRQEHGPRTVRGGAAGDHLGGGAGGPKSLRGGRNSVVGGFAQPPSPDTGLDVPSARASSGGLFSRLLGK